MSLSFTKGGIMWQVEDDPVSLSLEKRHIMVSRDRPSKPVTTDKP